MTSLNRREFVTGSIGAAASLAGLSQSRTYAANEKVIMGVMGLGGRGTYLAEQFALRPDVEIAYLCDVNTRRFARAREVVQEAQGKKPTLVQDFRKILDDRDVDVIINATPDHWHGLGTIMACQAGKDVYVEKPMAHNIWEGRQMIKAARKYKRVIQVGMQSRSAPYAAKAREYITSGKLGDVHLVRVFNMMRHPMQRTVPDSPVPEGLDYDMWCGPASKPPYNAGRQWLNQWDYSCGPIAGDAVHQMDLARYLTGDIRYPVSVSNAGGVDVLRDGRDTPDTQLTTFEYGHLTLMMEATLWTPYMKKIPWNTRDSDKFPNWPFCSTRIEIMGTEGFMYFGRHGGGWQVFDPAGEIVHSEFGRQGDEPHQENFIACIRNRNTPNTDVETGHYSSLLCNAANVSYRVGNQKLYFDGDKEVFKDNDQANAYLKRQYRQPWSIPAQV